MALNNSKFTILLLAFMLLGGCTTDNPTYVKILPFGDSITIGQPFSYRYELYKLIAKRHSNFVFVGSRDDNPANYEGTWGKRHEGHSGWTTQEIDQEFDRLTKDYSSDIALIHIGTNDILRHPAGTYDVSNSEAHMRSIISKLRNENSNVHIYVAQILPILHPDLDLELTEMNVGQWNSVVASLVVQLSTSASPVVLVDMHTGFDESSFIDGIHPSREAAKEMAARWSDAIVL
jgi:lysophospholipase L1-like esterase